MFVRSLCNQFCPEKIPVQLDTCIMGGADGELFSIVNEPNKVIKLSVLFDRDDRGIHNMYQQIQDVIDYIINTQQDAYVRIYEHGYLGAYSRDIPHWGEQEFIIHYHIMEKLYKLSEDENKIFHSIISHEDRGIIKDYSSKKTKKILCGLARGLDFDVEKVILFCNNIVTSAIIHNDIHPRNIMANIYGDYKLIDLDRCTVKVV